MKYSLVRLGTQAFFDGKTRDFIDEKDFEISNIEGTEHIIAKNKLSNKKHFVPIYNISYAEIKEEEQEKSELENESRQGAIGNNAEVVAVGSVEKKGKKSKKNLLL